jgi:hypothetical protein
MSQLTAAYGLFYLENRPILIRAVDLDGPADRGLLTAARDAGFNAIRPSREGLIDVERATDAGLVVLPVADSNAALPSIRDRPFAVAVEAQRTVARSTSDEPATVWGLPAEPASVASAVARGIRGYSVSAPPSTWETVGPVQRWLAQREEELTASIAIQDGLACIETTADALLFEGGFGVLALAGYNTPVVSLADADDAALAEYPAALFPCDGTLDLADYGKLVVLTLRGATLVTYPRPVQRTRDGTPYRTAFLWPVPATADSRVRPGNGERALGRRVQVRDGISTLLGEPFGEPYASSAYFRLPAGQRVAHRDLALSLFREAVAPVSVPARDLELEVIARLSPDGGALLFVVNRLGTQRGDIGIEDVSALHIGSDFTVETLFAGAGSSGERRGDGLAVEMAPADVLVLRLG